jgi:hypothetical protein
MIDIAKIAAEGVSSALGLAAIWRAPGLAPDAPGLAVSIVPSDADARVEIGRAAFGREAIRFRVYSVPVGIALDLKKSGTITRADDGAAMAGEVFTLTGDGEAADRGRYSWFVSVRRA